MEDRRWPADGQRSRTHLLLCVRRRLRGRAARALCLPLLGAGHQLCHQLAPRPPPHGRGRGSRARAGVGGVLARQVHPVPQLAAVHEPDQGAARQRVPAHAARRGAPHVPRPGRVLRPPVPRRRPPRTLGAQVPPHRKVPRAAAAPLGLRPVPAAPAGQRATDPRAVPCRVPHHRQRRQARRLRHRAQPGLPEEPALLGERPAREARAVPELAQLHVHRRRRAGREARVRAPGVQGAGHRPLPLHARGDRAALEEAQRVQCDLHPRPQAAPSRRDRARWPRCCPPASREWLRGAAALRGRAGEGGQPPPPPPPPSQGEGRRARRAARGCRWLLAAQPLRKRRQGQDEDRDAGLLHRGVHLRVGGQRRADHRQPAAQALERELRQESRARSEHLQARARHRTREDAELERYQRSAAHRVRSPPDRSPLPAPAGA
mmetsp:Transcript_46071/g.142127  ORF Transcript_46071/g.142127 Transcript_46071/m.142127 type:complete len:433 (+) Transcript_46071:256-1554(+)